MPQLSLHVEDFTATITFDNPPLQVMTNVTINELNAMLPRLNQDDVRVVILTGADQNFFIRHFSVEELDSSAQGETGQWDATMDDVLWAIEHLDKPVICAVNGSAMGGGLETVLACDIRVGKDGAFRYGLPEVSVGILPGGGGTQRLTALVGRNRALELMLRGRTFTPQQALEYGIFEELVSADSRETVLQRAQSIAREIAGRPPQAVKRIKQLARLAVSPVTMENLTLESQKFAELMAMPETQALLSGTAQAHKKERGA